MFDRTALISAIESAAEAWRDPEYPPRSEAVGLLLEAENTFTEEAVAYAVNQQMSLLRAERLMDWIGDRRATAELTVGVLNAGNIPLVELQDFLAVVLTGHVYLGSLSSRAPELLPAFVRDVRRRYGGLQASFVETEDLLEHADAVIATGTDETAVWVRARCDEHEIPQKRRLIRGNRFAVAVVDGRETPEELEGLAEDALLHEGFGCRNVAIVWSPKGLAPDDLLDAFAHFRGVFPAHADTPGRLKLSQAFLEAVQVPHAFGEGLEFLLSKGGPEVQQPGHIRWTEYEDIDEVRAWLAEHREQIQLVVARTGLAERLDVGVPIAAPGAAQRPELSWCPDGMDTVEFLAALSAP